MQCYDASLRNSKQIPGKCIYPYCNSKYYAAYHVSPFSHLQTQSNTKETYAGSTVGGFPYYANGYKWNNSALSMSDPYNNWSYNA